jgi:hypothetical protein
MSSALITHANLSLQSYDDAYQYVIDMHKELSREESEKANAKLILMLANHIGDPNVIREAAALARESTLDWRK